MILSAFAFGGIVYGLSSFGVEASAQMVNPLIPLIVGLVVMVLFGLVPNVREVFSISGFDKIFSIRDDAESAVAAVR